jgi:hypothetical protein
MFYVYPASTFLRAVTVQGEELPIEIGEDKAVEQPDSYSVHYVIGQFIESELLK